jgi:hypothetical protein
MKIVVIWALFIGILLNTYYCLFVSKETIIYKIIIWWIAYLFFSLFMLGSYIYSEENNKLNEDIKKKDKSGK